MSKGKRTRSGPPPLPNVAADDSTHVQPPPIVDTPVNDPATTDGNGKEPHKKGQPASGEADSEAKPAADPIAEFLSRAGAVIALERGINARSRVKLAAIADELELSEDDFAAAMEKLQAGGQQEKPLSREELREIRRRKRAFHHMVGETLTALPHGVLTSSMERMLVQSAVDEHGLPEDDARGDLLQLCQQLGVRRITQEEAERHVAELTDYALKPHGVLRKDVRQRIFAEASRWGLTPDQVEPILRERISLVRRGERRDQMRMVLLVSVSAAVLMGVLGMVAWMAFSRALPEPETVTDANNKRETIADSDLSGEADEPPRADSSPAPERLGVPAWWDDDLASYIANVRLRLPALESDLYQLRSPDAEVRADAYERLLDATHSSDIGKDEQAVLTGLFAAAYAVEPSDECADLLRKRWMERASAAGEKLPDEFASYAASLWVAETAISALMHEKLSDGRRTALLDALDRTYQTSLERDLPPLQLQRRIMAAAGAYLYKSLARHANENIDVAVDLHRELLSRIHTHLDAETSERLAAKYLRQVLPELGERWRIYEDLIRRCARSEDPLNVLLMVEIFESAENAALQNFLATQLVLRTGLSETTRRSVEELAADVRKELGITRASRPVDSAERFSQWRSQASELLAEDAPSTEDTVELLQHTVRAARLSTLGVALAQGELGEAEFAALWEKESPELQAEGGSTSSGGPRAPRPSTAALKHFDKHVDYLRNYERLNKIRRLSYLRGVASYAGRLPDVTPEQGQAIAAYLAAAKSVDEHESLMKVVDGVLRWRMVRLGLADQLVESRLRTEHLKQLVEAALHRDVDIERDGWRQRLRDELLAVVARELGTEASLAGGSSGPADRAVAALTDYYRTQAKLKGAPASAYADAKSPSDLLVLLIERSASELAGAELSPGDRETVDEAPHRLVAIDYVAPTDLAKTVQLQRLRLDLLVIAASGSNLKKSKQIRRLRADFMRQQAVANHVLSQLAAAERALLQFWLARNQP